MRYHNKEIKGIVLTLVYVDIQDMAAGWVFPEYKPCVSRKLAALYQNNLIKQIN